MTFEALIAAAVNGANLAASQDGRQQQAPAPQIAKGVGMVEAEGGFDLVRARTVVETGVWLFRTRTKTKDQPRGRLRATRTLAGDARLGPCSRRTAAEMELKSGVEEKKNEESRMGGTRTRHCATMHGCRPEGTALGGEHGKESAAVMIAYDRPGAELPSVSAPPRPLQEATSGHRLRTSQQLRLRLTGCHRTICTPTLSIANSARPVDGNVHRRLCGQVPAQARSPDTGRKVLDR